MTFIISDSVKYLWLDFKSYILKRKFEINSQLVEFLEKKFSKSIFFKNYSKKTLKFRKKNL